MKKISAVLSGTSLVLLFGVIGGLDRGTMPFQTACFTVPCLLLGMIVFAALSGAFRQKKSAQRDGHPRKAHSEKIHIQYNQFESICQGGKQ